MKIRNLSLQQKRIASKIPLFVLLLTFADEEQDAQIPLLFLQVDKMLGWWTKKLKKENTSIKI